VTFVTILAVAVGGLIGAPSRFLIDRRISDRWESDFPLGTFAINVSGSLVLGLVVGLSLAGHLPSEWKAFLGTGFCGAFTTFSTWSFETVRLFEEGEYFQGSLNVVLSLALGLAAAGAGLALGLSV
jgi:CrcB protein